MVYIITNKQFWCKNTWRTPQTDELDDFLIVLIFDFYLLNNSWGCHMLIIGLDPGGGGAQRHSIDSIRVRGTSSIYCCTPFVIIPNLNIGYSFLINTMISLVKQQDKELKHSKCDCILVWDRNVGKMKYCGMRDYLHFSTCLIDMEPLCLLTESHPHCFMIRIGTTNYRLLTNSVPTVLAALRGDRRCKYCIFLNENS